LRQVGVILLVEAALFLFGLLVAAEWGLSHYDTHRDTISILGILPGTDLFFNATAVTIGLMNLLAAYLGYRGRLGILTVLAFILAGVGFAGVGIITVEISEPVHTISAGVGFLGHLIMPFVVTRSSNGPMRAMSYLAALASVIALIVWLAGESLRIGFVGEVGFMQRMVIFPLAFWMLTFGGYVTATRGR